MTLTAKKPARQEPLPVTLLTREQKKAADFSAALLL
jgi:hypothetical protein